MKYTRLTMAAGLILVPALAMAGDDKSKAMDTDGDGAISSAEHAAAAQKMFTGMDADHDGYVTAAEMDAHWAAKGKGDKAGKMKMSSADRIKELDTDGDGRISAAEHEAGSQKMFAKMDANADGKITEAEMQAGHDRVAKKSGY